MSDFDSKGRDAKGRFTKENPFGWKRGQSGNPRGRPPVRRSITDALRQLSEERVDETRTRVQALADVLWKLALEGNVTAAKEILDRLEGRSPQHISVDGNVDTRQGVEIAREMLTSLVARGMSRLEAKDYLLSLGVSQEDLDLEPVQ
jgi:hypothetical protein